MNTIGFIGKATITKEEQKDLEGIGKLIALHGNPTVMVNGGATVKAVKKGIESEGGTPELVTTGVIEQAHHTFIYADEDLYRRLLDAYPDIQTQTNVTILCGQADLTQWREAIERVYSEKQTQ